MSAITSAGPRIPIAGIKNNGLRRAAMIAAFPLLIAWYFNWRMFAFPIAVIWNATRSAIWAAADSIYLDLHTRPLRLLYAAWRKMWNEPLGD